MIIKNASVFTEDYKFENRDIYIKDGVFVKDEAEADSSVVIDAEGCFAIPGLTDLHFHGCMGFDFCDGTPEAVQTIAKYQASVGVTSIVPATMTLDEEVLVGICKNGADYVSAGSADDEADLCGINMEGPFVAESKKGAQNGAYIRKTDCGLFDRLNEASGHMIKLVAVAPETEGAIDFIRDRHDQAVMSLAHTAADYDKAMEAFENGASHVTHLYNAMHPFTHRSPGPIGAAADAGAEVELICDGVHIHPAVVRSTFKLFGDDKVILISDSMMATGLDDGDYSLGGQAVKVVGNKATLANGTIAGSATNLLDCMRNAVRDMKVPLESAVKAAAVNPAKSVGIYDQYGSISVGKKANVVLLKKEDLALEAVVLRGNKL